MVRRDGLAETMSRYLIDQLERTPNIEVRPHRQVAELVGDRSVEALVVEDTRTAEREPLDAIALFVFIGADPHTAWASDEVLLDDKGFVLTGHELVGRLEGEPPPPCPSRQAGRESSRSATSARARSSGSPLPWARARWRCVWCTSTCPER